MSGSPLPASSQGWKVAVATRSLKDDLKKVAQQVLQVDFTDPGAVAGVFEKVEKELGMPNVVVYNGKMVTLLTPFSHAQAVGVQGRSFL